jgi:iron complex transport system substrate-binding protein
MPTDESTSTRRATLKYGAAAAASGLLAGCAGTTDEAGTSTSPSTATDTGSYTVEMFPVGEVAFDEVPETWMATYRDAWGDMAVALGQADGNRSSTLYRLGQWYDLLGIEYDSDHPDTWQNGAFDKEVYYELDCDVHLMDPNDVAASEGLDEADVEEIAESVGPFFGSFIRRYNSQFQTDLNYAENAPTMLEAFEKVGEVFQEGERARAFLDLHDEVQTEVESRMEGVEPVEIGLLNGGSDASEGLFYALDPTSRGYEMKHFRDIGVENAFEGVETGQYGETDYETLLEVDPDVIVYHSSISTDFSGYWDPESFRERRIEAMEAHEVGQNLTAVQNGNVYPGGYYEQGPIVSLFSLELAGQTLYPEQFGEFPIDQYPEVPEENRLFDRQRVADIVNGDI